MVGELLPVRPLIDGPDYNTSQHPLQHWTGRLVSGIWEAEGDLNTANCCQVGLDSARCEPLFSERGGKETECEFGEREWRGYTVHVTEALKMPCRYTVGLVGCGSEALFKVMMKSWRQCGEIQLACWLSSRWSNSHWMGEGEG